MFRSLRKLTWKPDESEVKAANRRLHRALAPEYDNRQAIYHPAVMRHLRSLVLPHLAGKKGLALDAGCGTGFILDLLGETGFDFVCFDLSPEMVARAQEKHPAAGFAVADSFFPPFRRETFDLLAVSGLLHHIVDYGKLLENLLALVKKGGTVLILNEPNARGYRFFAPVRPITRALIPEKRVGKHVRTGVIRETDEAAAEYQINYGKGVDPQIIASLLAVHDFRIKKLEYMNLGILANLGDRLSLDLLETFPLLGKLPAGVFSPDFNIIAERV